jgi:calpain-7
LNFTIRVYSVIPFEFFEIPRGNNFEKRISGFWTKENAGGNISHPTFYRNPQYKLSISPSISSSAKNANQDKVNLIIMLEAPKSFPINIKLVKSGKRISNCSSKDLTGSSNSYRHGFCYLELDDVEPDDYTIIVSTFDPGLISGFFLTISCSHNFSTTVIPPEGEGYQKYVLPGDWIENKSAMGCSLYKDYFKNPRYIIEASCPTKLFIRMQITKMNPIPAMNVSIFERINMSENKEIISSGPYTNTTQGVVTKEILIYPDKIYFVVFSTWKPEPGKFLSYIYVDNPIKIKQILE